MSFGDRQRLAGRPIGYGHLASKGARNETAHSSAATIHHHRE
jgi:hypothetical protein